MSSLSHRSSPFARLPILFDTLALTQLSDDQQQLISDLEHLLPQTQCGLCGYKDGCLPYAHAIVTKDEAINLCVPGGNATVLAISQLTGKPYLPAMPSKWATNPSTNRPQSVLAMIDEMACIGCTKCIPACPVDAIIGTAKHSHSIIKELCTGCELCVAPCPVDCIDIVPNGDTTLAPASTLRTLYHRHLDRMANRLKLGDTTPVVSHTESKLANTLLANQKTTISEQSAKNTVALAKLRTQIKKLEKQLSVRYDEDKQAQLIALNTQLTALENQSQ